MDHEIVRPRIFISRCLGFDHCRWNGDMISDEFVDKLKPYVDCVHVCPEIEAGLGVPRNPVRIIKKDTDEQMVQLDTGYNVTQKMHEFSTCFLESLDHIDGCILKDRSPSCGLKDVKVYSGLDSHNTIGKTSGLFTKALLERFPGIAIETEGRLKNFSIREAFLTALFSLARFRTIETELRMKDLIQFHAEYKLLLMAYNQKGLRILGRITANHEKKDPEYVFSEYREQLRKVFAKPSRYTSNINVLMHAFGYFSKQLSSVEKTYFLNTLEEYRREQIPLSVPLRLIRGYAIRFNEQYLLQQAFFEPYPPDLVNISDSGKGRGS